MSDNQKNSNSGINLENNVLLESGGYYRIYKDLLGLDLTMKEHLIFGYFDGMARNQRVSKIWVSYAGLANEFGITRRHAIRSVKRLVKHNLLTSVKRKGSTNLWSVNLYLKDILDNDGKKLTAVQETENVDNSKSGSDKNVTPPSDKNVTPPSDKNVTLLKRVIKNKYKKEEETRLKIVDKNENTATVKDKQCMDGVQSYRVMGTRFKKNKNMQEIGDVLKEIKKDMKNRQGIDLKE